MVIIIHHRDMSAATGDRSRQSVTKVWPLPMELGETEFVSEILKKFEIDFSWVMSSTE